MIKVIVALWLGVASIGFAGQGSVIGVNQVLMRYAWSSNVDEWPPEFSSRALLGRMQLGRNISVDPWDILALETALEARDWQRAIDIVERIEGS